MEIVDFTAMKRREVEAMGNYPWGLSPDKIRCADDREDVELVS